MGLKVECVFIELHIQRRNGAEGQQSVNWNEYARTETCVSAQYWSWTILAI